MQAWRLCVTLSVAYLIPCYYQLWYATEFLGDRWLDVMPWKGAAQLPCIELRRVPARCRLDPRPQNGFS